MLISAHKRLSNINIHILSDRLRSQHHFRYLYWRKGYPYTPPYHGVNFSHKVMSQLHLRERRRSSLFPGHCTSLKSSLITGFLSAGGGISSVSASDWDTSLGFDTWQDIRVWGRQEIHIGNPPVNKEVSDRPPAVSWWLEVEEENIKHPCKDSTLTRQYVSHSYPKHFWVCDFRFPPLWLQ